MNRVAALPLDILPPFSLTVDNGHRFLLYSVQLSAWQQRAVYKRVSILGLFRNAEQRVR